MDSQLSLRDEKLSHNWRKCVRFLFFTKSFILYKISSLYKITIPWLWSKTLKMTKFFAYFWKLNILIISLSGSLLAEAKRPRYSGSKLSGHSEIDTSVNRPNLSIPFSDLIAFRDRSNLEKIDESPEANS